MTEVSLYQNRRFNDSLERDLMQRALGNGETVSMAAVFKASWSALKTTGAALSEYVISVTRALNEARARDAEMSGSQW